MAHLRALVDDVLDGREDDPRDDDADPHAAGIRLGAALKASGIAFHVGWDRVAPGLAHVTVDRTAIEHVNAAHIDADPVDVDDARVSYLLTGSQCHALAARFESTWGETEGT